jgi:LEA14-like dessication related protein
LDIVSDKTINVNLIVTGVDQITENSIVVYPNPATDIVFIRSTASVGLVQVFSITGSLVMELKPQNEEVVDVPVNNLLRGTYIIRVKFNNGNYFHSKLIKL